MLLLWADRDRYHPLAGAEEARDLLPDALLRVLPGTGFLIAYDDPVGRRARAHGLLRMSARPTRGSEVVVGLRPQNRDGVSNSVTTSWGSKVLSPTA